MNKKISFSRPQKPLPQAADDWVSSGEQSDASHDTTDAKSAMAEAPASEPKKKAKPARKPRKKPAAKATSRPADTGVKRASPTLGATDIKWAERMLASVERQTGFVHERLARSSFAGGTGDPQTEALRADLIEHARSIIHTMEALQKNVGKHKDAG